MFDGKLQNELFGALHRRVNGIVLRIENGTLDYQRVMKAFQMVAEGEFPPTGPLIINWRLVYKALGMAKKYDAGFSPNAVKLVPSVYRWMTPILKNVTCDKVIAAFREININVSLCASDLDSSVTENDRNHNNGSYIVSFASNVEADENLKNLSANKLAEQGVKGITLLERLVLGFGYFLTTGKHLDEKNVTLCIGSRRSDGGVPGVNWDVGSRKLCVSWYSADVAYDNLRARAVVSSKRFNFVF
jgi:hypothetical protein